MESLVNSGRGPSLFVCLSSCPYSTLFRDNQETTRQRWPQNPIGSNTARTCAFPSRVFLSLAKCAPPEGSCQICQISMRSVEASQLKTNHPWKQTHTDLIEMDKLSSSLRKQLINTCPCRLCRISLPVLIRSLMSFGYDFGYDFWP